jgi:hypothetical protein
MRSILHLFVVLLSLTLVLGNRARFPGQPNATPTKGPENARRLRQMSRQELVARAKYPEMFGKRQDPPAEEDPSSSSSSDEAAATQQPNPDCPEAPTRKRSLAMRPEKPLDPRDMAKFLLGRGEFTW